MGSYNWSSSLFQLFFLGNGVLVKKNIRFMVTIYLDFNSSHNSFLFHPKDYVFLPYTKLNWEVNGLPNEECKWFEKLVVYEFCVVQNVSFDGVCFLTLSMVQVDLVRCL